MLIRLLLVCALIVVLVFLVQQFQRKSAARQKILKWQLVLGLVALMLIVLAATGRIHWLGAVFATLLAFFRQLIPLLLKWSPAIKQLYQHYQQQKHSSNNQHSSNQNSHNQQQNRPPNNPGGNMQRKEALQILGLNETATRDDIIKAHRKLMQKVHPDRGGSAELAAQVNRAKDILLG
jgi:glucan phosphoethanolaminetransferase (alkaline phosphatase superfamily)